MFICNLLAGMPLVMLWGTKYGLPMVTQINIRKLLLTRLAATQAHLFSISLLIVSPLWLLRNNTLGILEYQETSYHLGESASHSHLLPYEAKVLNCCLLHPLSMGISETPYQELSFWYLLLSVRIAPSQDHSGSCRCEGRWASIQPREPHSKLAWAPLI